MPQSDQQTESEGIANDGEFIMAVKTGDGRI